MLAASPTHAVPSHPGRATQHDSGLRRRRVIARSAPQGLRQAQTDLAEPTYDLGDGRLRHA
jgi:hypothetical protein